jgi:DNA-binding transcriptional regulator GbsR (MarR family)
MVEEHEHDGPADDLLDELTSDLGDEPEAHPRPARVPDVLTMAQDQFILEWGRMSSSWGINRTMAQIHALLFVTGEPLEVNEIMDRLQISRGNASMNLRELIDWGVVRRFRQPGDRKDTYITEVDPYQMFVRIVKERKRREIDPTAEAIAEVLARLPEHDASEEVQSLRARLQALLEIFGIVDAVYKEVLKYEISLTELKEFVKRAKTVA